MKCRGNACGVDLPGGFVIHHNPRSSILPICCCCLPCINNLEALFSLVRGDQFATTYEAIRASALRNTFAFLLSTTQALSIEFSTLLLDIKKPLA